MKNEKAYGHLIRSSSGLRPFEFVLLPILGLLPELLGVALCGVALWVLCRMALPGVAL